MLSLAYAAQILVMVGAPVALMVALRRRWPVSATLFLAGAVAWIASQAIHLPMNHGLQWLGALVPPPAVGAEPWRAPLFASLAGLTAGLCEETTRWALFRFVLRRARSSREAVAVGLGHGGLESMWFGMLSGATLLSSWAAARAGLPAMGIPPEAIPEAQAQLDAVFTAPAWVPLVAAAERLMTMFFHVTASVLVMVAVARRRLWPLLLAILWHAALDAGAVWTMAAHGAMAAELVLLAWMPLCALVLWRCSRALSR